MSPRSDSGKHTNHHERKNGSTERILGWLASTSRKTHRGMLIPASVVEGDNSHRVDVELANVSCRRMEIPKRQKIATMMSSVVLDKTIGDLPQRDVLSDRSCREGTKSEVPVDLDVTEIPEELKKRVQAMCQDFRDIFISRTFQLDKVVGVKQKMRLTYETPFQDRPRRIPPAMYEEVRQHLKEMLECGAIGHSHSPWGSNVVLVRKDGSL